MNQLDQARKLTKTLQKTLDELRFNQSIRLNRVEIERLYEISKANPNELITVQSTPSSIAPIIEVFLESGDSIHISDVDSW